MLSEWPIESQFDLISLDLHQTLHNFKMLILYNNLKNPNLYI